MSSIFSSLTLLLNQGSQSRAATLDNLFSPTTGTEIPYVPLQHNMQFSPMFPYVPLQILYFPYKYCIFVWKNTAELPSSDG
jgi:hypothetical protein